MLGQVHEDENKVKEHNRELTEVLNGDLEKKAQRLMLGPRLESDEVLSQVPELMMIDFEPEPARIMTTNYKEEIAGLVNRQKERQVTIGQLVHQMGCLQNDKTTACNEIMRLQQMVGQVQMRMNANELQDQNWRQKQAAAAMLNLTQSPPATQQQYQQLPRMQYNATKQPAKGKRK